MNETSVRAFLPAGVLFLLGLIGLGVLSLRPYEGDGAVVALFPPWWETTDAFMAAIGADVGHVVASGRWPSMVLIPADGIDPRPRLREAGAWLLLEPTGLAGCFGARA